MKRVILGFFKVILVSASILLFLIIVAWYFFAFDLQWGINKQALTLGLPLLAAIVFIPLCLVYLVKRKQWRWGFFSVISAVIVLVYTGLILWNYSYLVAGAPINNPQNTPDTLDNKVYFELFSRSEGYVTVDPEIVIRDSSFGNSEHIKEAILSSFGNTNSDVTMKQTINRLYEKFLEVNSAPARLSIKSAPNKGYYIDYDGKFSKYFEDDIGMAWNRMIFCRPGVGIVNVSLPAYDEESGLIICYYDCVRGSLAGAGGIYVFRLIGTELKYLYLITLWIS